MIVKNKNGKSFDKVSLVKFVGSPRNPFGTHCSFRFKGGIGGYKNSWKVHFSQVNGGAWTPVASGPIRGTVRRVAMIAAGMKPPCRIVESEGLGARGGAKSPLPGKYPQRPSDYGLSSWLKPGDEGVDKKEAMTFTCNDLNIIKRAATAEIKRRIKDREAMKKDLSEEEIEELMKQEGQDGFHNKDKNEVKKMDELIKVLKDITGIELSKKQIDAIKTLSEEEVKEFNGALEVIDSYKDELPEELNEKIASITKFTVKEQPDPKSPEITEEKKAEILKEFEKAGKKLSKDTIDIIEGAVKKLSSITEVVEALSRLLPEGKKEGTKKAVAKGEEDKMTVNLSFDDVGLKEGLEKMGKDIKDSFEKALVERDKKIEGLDKKLEGVDELSKRIKTLEGVKGVKKGLEEEEEGAKKKDVKWPSFEVDKE